MTTLVIQTQYQENYAAHNENYKHGVDEAYWKFKGGTTYYVNDLSEKDINAIVEKGIPNIESLITYENAGSREYILDWELRELGKDGDGKGPICEKWETPVELWYDRSTNEWKARTFKYDDEEFPMWNEAIIARAQQWVCEPEGGRNNFQQQYKTKNGWFDYKDEKLREELVT